MDLNKPEIDTGYSFSHAKKHLELYTSDHGYKKAEIKVYIVDDQESIFPLLAGGLKDKGYMVEGFSSAGDVLDKLVGPDDLPDLIITDIMMPGLSGVEMVRFIREKHPGLPVIAITGFLTGDLYKDLFEQRFSAVIPKPVPMRLLLQEVKVVLEEAQIPNYKKLNDALVLTIANMGDARDALTQYHNLRLGDISYAVACEMELDDGLKEDLRLAVRMHDIGKLSIRDEVLKKPGRLTPDEFEHIKTHAAAGAGILQPLAEILPMDYLKMACEIALSHHEKLDGSGYPAGLKGSETPIYVRISTVADIFDACTMRRTYHDSKTHEFGLKIITEEMEAGKLDPDVVAAFKQCSDRIIEIKQRFSEDQYSASSRLGLPRLGNELPGCVVKTHQRR